MASAARSAARFLLTLAALASGSLGASASRAAPPPDPVPILDTPVTQDSWSDVASCHNQPRSLADQSPGCLRLQRCADQRCRVLTALADAADRTEWRIFPGLGIRPPGSGLPPNTAALPIQPLLAKHPDWLPIASNLLVRLAHGLPYETDDEVILTLATVVDPTGATEHRMADALDHTVDGDEAILDAREGCYFGTLPACAGLRR